MCLDAAAQFGRRLTIVDPIAFSKCYCVRAAAEVAMYKTVAAVAVLLFVTNAEAAKRRQKKPAQPAIEVGSSCDVAHELAMRSGSIKMIAVGASVQVTRISRDDLVVRTAAGSGSVRRQDLLAACSSVPRVVAEATPALAAE
jgi:hypothetical protein